MSRYKTSFFLSAAVIALLANGSAGIAQTAANGLSEAFPGYVPRSSGMTSGVPSATGTQDAATPAEGAASAQDASRSGPRQSSIPGLSDGNALNQTKIDGFNEAIEQKFPMTPEMIRQYNAIMEANDRAYRERVEPRAVSDMGLISLEPGEAAPDLMVSRGIASVVGFYDATGKPWPVKQFILGSQDAFQVIPMQEGGNSLAVTPLVGTGFTNLVVSLETEPKPVIIRLEISDNTVHQRRDLQIMRPGPNAEPSLVTTDIINEAGNPTLIAAVAGVDLPASARPVAIRGVNARGWLLGDKILVRSKDSLISPPYSSALSGPDGVKVYEIPRSAVALFSVNGRIVRADIDLP